MLAVPNSALTAAGLAQSAFDASLNHALSDCSASAYSRFSQNNRSVLREMILISQPNYGTIPNWEQWHYLLKYFRKGSADFLAASSLKTTDLALLFGSLMSPFSCNRSMTSQS